MMILPPGKHQGESVETDVYAVGRYIATPSSGDCLRRRMRGKDGSHLRRNAGRCSEGDDRRRLDGTAEEGADRGERGEAAKSHEPWRASETEGRSTGRCPFRPAPRTPGRTRTPRGRAEPATEPCERPAHHYQSGVGSRASKGITSNAPPVRSAAQPDPRRGVESPRPTSDRAACRK